MSRVFLSCVLVSAAGAAVNEVEDYIRPACGVHRVLRNKMIEERKRGDQTITQKNVDDADARYQKCVAEHPTQMTEEEARVRRDTDVAKEREEWMKRPLHPAGAIAPMPSLSASDQRILDSALRCYCRGRTCALEPMREKPLSCKNKRVSEVLRCMNGRACDDRSAGAAREWLRANPQ